MTEKNGDAMQLLRDAAKHAPDLTRAAEMLRDIDMLIGAHGVAQGGLTHTAVFSALVWATWLLAARNTKTEAEFCDALRKLSPQVLSAPPRADVLSWVTW